MRNFIVINCKNGVSPHHKLRKEGDGRAKATIRERFVYKKSGNAYNKKIFCRKRGVNRLPPGLGSAEFRELTEAQEPVEEEFC